MPFVNHNSHAAIERLKERSDAARLRIRKLRHAIEHGAVEPLEGTLAELGRELALLDASIRTYTIRHDYLHADDSVAFSTYEDPLAFIGAQIAGAPGLALTKVEHEEEIYRELGYTKQEFDDLMAWKEALDLNGLNVRAAYDHFVSHVLRDLQAAQYKISIRDIAPGVAGMVGIAANVTFFVASGSVPTLVSSCTTGLAAIAARFPDVRDRLHAGWG